MKNKRNKGIVYPTTSYQEQYNRVRNDVAPLRGVDREMVLRAEQLEKNAADQMDRKLQPADDSVEEG